MPDSARVSAGSFPGLPANAPHRLIVSPFSPDVCLSGNIEGAVQQTQSREVILQLRKVRGRRRFISCTFQLSSRADSFMRLSCLLDVMGVPAPAVFNVVFSRF
jgi:hypothetical protein